MVVQFATCEVKKGLEYLQTGYASKTFTEENMPILCKALRNDHIRITDPAMQTLALVVGKQKHDDPAKLMAEISNEIVKVVE